MKGRLFQRQLDAIIIFDIREQLKVMIRHTEQLGIRETNIGEN